MLHKFDVFVAVGNFGLDVHEIYVKIVLFIPFNTCYIICIRCYVNVYFFYIFYTSVKN